MISGLLTQYGLPPLGMFVLTPVGLPIATAGLIYLWTVGRRLLPAGREDSRLAGKTLAESSTLWPARIRAGS